MAKVITLNLRDGGTIEVDVDSIQVISAEPKGCHITTVEPDGRVGKSYHIYETVSRLRSMMAG